MAKYIYLPDNQGITYALDECEDYLVLDAYLRIKEKTRDPRVQQALLTFERFHLSFGKTLNDNVLVVFNTYLQNLGEYPITFVRGYSTDYGHMRDTPKAEARAKILQHLRSLTKDMRDKFIQTMREEAAALTPQFVTERPNVPAVSERTTRIDQKQQSSVSTDVLAASVATLVMTTTKISEDLACVKDLLQKLLTLQELHRAAKKTPKKRAAPRKTATTPKSPIALVS